MPGTQVSDSDMHPGTCVTHVTWYVPGSITSGFLWSRWRGKRPRHYRRMRSPQFCVSGIHWTTYAQEQLSRSWDSITCTWRTFHLLGALIENIYDLLMHLFNICHLRVCIGSFIKYGRNQLNLLPTLVHSQAWHDYLQGSFWVSAQPMRDDVTV